VSFTETLLTGSKFFAGNRSMPHLETIDRSGFLRAGGFLDARTSWTELCNVLGRLAQETSKRSNDQAEDRSTMGELYNIYPKILRFKNKEAKEQECTKYPHRAAITSVYSGFSNSINREKLLHIGLVIVDAGRVHVGKQKPLEDRGEHSWVIVVLLNGPKRRTYIYDPNTFGRICSAGGQLTASGKLKKSESRMKLLSISQKRVLLKLGDGKIKPSDAIWTLGQGNEEIRSYGGRCLQFCIRFIHQVVYAMDDKGDWSPPESEYPLPLVLKRTVTSAQM
jgi:hypothetical protein